MVTRAAKQGKMVAELSVGTYNSIVGEVRKYLHSKAYISAERVTVDGKRVVRIWCKYPKAAKNAIKSALYKKGIKWS